jgi:hypothetical protein
MRRAVCERFDVSFAEQDVLHRSIRDKEPDLCAVSIAGIVWMCASVSVRACMCACVYAVGFFLISLPLLLLS